MVIRVTIDADELVRRYVRRKFQSECEFDHRHLAACPEMQIVVDDAHDGTYGCDTGCEYVRFEATISCPHSDPVEYEFGEFGELSWMIEEMQRDEQKRL